MPELPPSDAAAVEPQPVEAAPSSSSGLAPATLQASAESDARVDSPATGALLACAGGFLDAFTYVGHGHVFANAMTGNVVLLGVNCVSGDWHTGLRHLPPIIAFFVGILAAKTIEFWARPNRLHYRYLAVLALETAILSLLSLLPVGAADFWITTSIAFAASVQVETFRKVRGRSYNSTFTTGNLRTLSEGIFDWWTGARDPENAHLIADFALICGAFLAGAVAGGLATTLARNYGFLNHALWIDILLLFVVAVRVRSRWS